jgi:hypothetical protein
MLHYPNVGDVVVFHDQKGVAHNALVTCYHGQVDEAGEVCGNVGCVNLIFVSGDESRKDGYGRQTEHESSVPYVVGWNAHGFYWRWQDDKPIPYREPAAS